MVLNCEVIEQGSFVPRLVAVVDHDAHMELHAQMKGQGHRPELLDVTASTEGP